MGNKKTYDTKDYIVIKGAHKHNLKNIDVAIKRNSFTVITGLSGSGKTSLAYDTIFAEGQRRYVESLSSYARQFLARMDKADVEYIEGIAPAVAIQQKAISRNPRSTVGTSTEIYEYLKLLYARIGKTFSPISEKEVKKQGIKDVLDYIFSLEEGYSLEYKMVLLSEGVFFLRHSSDLSSIDGLQDFPGRCKLEGSYGICEVNEHEDNNFYLLEDSPDSHFSEWVLEKPEKRFYDLGGYVFVVVE